MLPRLIQSPRDPAFVQDPYPFYDRARALGPLVWWEDYAMPATFDYATVNALLRDRRFGRECPAELVAPRGSHVAPFYAIDDHSMLERDGADHKRLRGLVLRAFTSRRIAGLAPDISELANALIDRFPDPPFDLLEHFATPIPVIIIARLLGVPEDDWPALLRWSHHMVAMYQAGRTREIEERAAQAASAFTSYLSEHLCRKRMSPADDLMSHLIAARDGDRKLSEEELIATCILLLNAGHEATVHSIANGVAALISASDDPTEATRETAIDSTVEEILRYDPPLHMFLRYAHEPVTVAGHLFRRGDQVALVLGAANRDPGPWDQPRRFNPRRPIVNHVSFGAGAHFCLGAPLARLELKTALPILFDRCPDLRLAGPPVYADSYHFHGLTRLLVQR